MNDTPTPCGMLTDKLYVPEPLAGVREECSPKNEKSAVGSNTVQSSEPATTPDRFCLQEKAHLTAEKSLLEHSSVVRLLERRHGVQISSRSILHHAASNAPLQTWSVGPGARCEDGHRSLVTPNRVLEDWLLIDS